ncbi:MAG: cytidylate kinase-like family protein [Proteobacteria bacterium]|nr:cytidylate kinase-like family protein [Pseudomonadota bacterium]
MTIKIGGKNYVPGMYSHKKFTGAQLADKYFSDVEKKLIEKQKALKRPEIHPCISFSRKIGVGALEVADILGEDLGYPVMDREILTHIACEANLSEKTVKYFDERYPGMLNEFMKYLFGEKAFIKSDYSRHLFSVVLSLGGTASTIFVGRGTHLILPKNRTLAVRCTCSDEYRSKRLSRMLEVSEKEAAAKLAQIDKEQQEFFKKTFGKTSVESHEFDLVLNFDLLKEPASAAKIIKTAFMQKFQSELCG